MGITTYMYDSCGATHKGMRREYNEDCYLADPALGIYLVADGMGGHQAGDVASRLAVDAIQKRLGETLPNVKNHPDSLGNAVLDALNQANHAIRRNPISDLERNQGKMGTTAALVVTRGDAAIVAHVGDSRVYRLRRGKLQMLTRDHSFLQAQVGAGFVSNDEARQSHNRNLITRALGMEATVSADIGQSKVAAGDVFLICSDGLTTMVTDEDIETIVEELKENLELACQVLVQAANDNGGHDNISVVLLRADAPGQAPAPAPGFWGRLFARLFGK
ncbi:MAG: Stp1/IreP family PP2C-type Ser/Thr phosphatase [Pseudomonadota bacterium]